MSEQDMRGLCQLLRLRKNPEWIQVGQDAYFKNCGENRRREEEIGCHYSSNLLVNIQNLL